MKERRCWISRIDKNRIKKKEIKNEDGKEKFFPSQCLEKDSFFCRL